MWGNANGSGVGVGVSAAAAGLQGARRGPHRLAVTLIYCVRAQDCAPLSPFLSSPLLSSPLLSLPPPLLSSPFLSSPLSSPSPLLSPLLCLIFTSLSCTRTR